MRALFRAVAILLSIGSFYSCRVDRSSGAADDPFTPRFLEIDGRPSGGWSLVSVSPFDGSRDTLEIEKPVKSLIVMSTSYIGFLDAIGRLDVVSGVSGKEYIYAGTGGIADVGYDAAPDYEKIVALKPDVLLTYTVSAAKSQFLSKLEQLGVKVFIVNEHLESHPLARAAYVRLFGALTGEMEAADSVLAAVRSNYVSLADSVSSAGSFARKVLLNIPYNDQWFVPSRESYLTAMIGDAGGTVLGSEPGRAASTVMSLEKAYSLSKEADCWLNTGWCQTMKQLLGVNPLFEDMAAEISGNASERGFGGGTVVWNDNLRLNGKGGNDIWESGVARPDLVLRDLVSILHPELLTTTPLYYRPLVP